MKKIVFNLIQIIIGAILIFSIVMVVFPLLPPFRGFYHTRTVLTGSMEPSIGKDSVVINKWIQDRDLKEGDIVTFQKPTDRDVFITHRIQEVKKTTPLYKFQTKGDANETTDFWEITQANVEGKVIFVIPYLGYLIEFFKTPIGFILIVVLPLLIFIIKEVFQAKRIYQDVKKSSQKEENTIKGKEKILFTIVIITLILLSQAQGTFALFSSEEVSMVGINLQTAATFPSVEERDVVINELMWMGSDGCSSDEWIELRNTTGGSIDLTGWSIDNAGSGSDSISLSGSIPANGYFLVGHYASTSSSINDTIAVDQVVPGISLLDGGEQLILRDASNNVIDQTPSGAWPAGISSTLQQSMERDNDPLTGWHTCTDNACNDTTYWDSEGNNYGTPKAANLSDEKVGEQTLEFFLREDKKAVGFKVKNTAEYESLGYEIVYDTQDSDKGIVSSIEINGQEVILRENLVLGTCSGIEEEICCYDEGITEISLKVSLIKETGEEKILEKAIDY